MFVKKFTALLLVLFAIQTSVVVADGTQPSREVLLIIDSSGSMKEKTSDGIEKMTAARQALQKVLPQLEGEHVGLLLFGHRVAGNRAGCCEDIELAIPIGPLSASKFTSTVNRIQPLGNTPLAQSLWFAKDVLTKREKDVQKTVIVLTDGNETCNGDPQAAAAALASLGINVKVHVVGFAVTDQQERQLKSIAASGNGEYTSAKNAADLIEKLPEFLLEKPAPLPQPVVELSRIEAALVARLKDKDFIVRTKAAETLQKMNAVATVPYLAEAIQDEELISGITYSKEAALKALASMAPEQVVDALRRTASSKNRAVRKWVAKEMANVQEKSTGTKLSVVDQTLVHFLNDSDFMVRVAAADSLRTRKTIAAAPYLVRSIEDGRPLSGIGYAKDAAFKALKVLAPTEVEDAILKALESKNDKVRSWATDKLADLN